MLDLNEEINYEDDPGATAQKLDFDRDQFTP